MDITDKSLIEANNSGQSWAFEQLVRRYGPSLLGYLIKICGSREKAEDYFQQTFMKVFENAKNFRGGSFKSWLFRIGTNVVMDGFRREKVRSHFSIDGFAAQDDCEGENASVSKIEENSANPSDCAAKAESILLVRRLINLLPERQRVTLVLNYYEQLTFTEVANIMNCSVGTVKRQMYRAMKTLAVKLPDRGLL